MTAPAVASGAGRSRQDRTEHEIDAITFRFRCLGHAFRAWIHREGETRSICVACDVGHLPYSAEDREGRRNALIVLSRAGHITGTRVVLSNFHRVSIVSSLPLGNDHSGAAILSGAVAAVLNATPLIGLMSECLPLPYVPAG